MLYFRSGLVLILFVLLSGAAPPEGIWQASLNYGVMGLLVHQDFSLEIREHQVIIRESNDSAPSEQNPSTKLFSIEETLPGPHRSEGALLLRNEVGAYSLVPYRLLDAQHLQIDLTRTAFPLREKSLAFTSLPDLDFDKESAQLLYHQSEYQRLSALPAKDSFSPAEAEALRLRFAQLSQSEPYKSRIEKSTHSTMGMLSGIYLRNDLQQLCLIEAGYAPFAYKTFKALMEAMQNLPTSSEE